jgi:hypothetical protein
MGDDYDDDVPAECMKEEECEYKDATKEKIFDIVIDVDNAL